MSQIAELQAMVDALRYKPGWEFMLRYGATSSAGASVTGPQATTSSIGSAGHITLAHPPLPVTLAIIVRTPDAHKHEKIIYVPHTFAVPPEDDHPPWDEWLLACIHNVEVHEMCEFYQVGGHRPFYPEHGPTANLYSIKRRPGG
jgi:hypothetical protein